MSDRQTDHLHKLAERCKKQAARIAELEEQLNDPVRAVKVIKEFCEDADCVECDLKWVCSYFGTVDSPREWEI